MNLSQILNPPGSSTSGISNRQGRTTSPPAPLASSTNVLRFDIPSNGNTGGGATSRKHSNSVSVSQLEEQAFSQYNPNATTTATTTASATTKSGGGSSTGTYQRIRSNEINSGYSTHTFRANPPTSKENMITTTSASSNPSNTVSMPVPGAESSIFQDSFPSKPSEPYEASSSMTSKKKPAKKVTQSPINPIENESQPLEIRFVITDKDGQDKQRSQKQSTTSTQKDKSPSRDSPGDDTASQESSQSSPTPDFERNADGNYIIPTPRVTVKCDASADTSSSLSHHRVVHTDQNLRPYVCRHNRCGATYTQLARLITHQRTTHSGMILFIPQDSSSSSAANSPSTTSQSQAIPSSSNNPQNNLFNSSQSLPSTPSGHAAGGSTFVTTRSVSPPTSEPSNNRISESSRPEDHGQQIPHSILDLNSEQGLASFSRSPAEPATSHSNEQSGNSGGTEQDNETQTHHDHKENNIETEEKEEKEEDSDEMRQKEEAALTMTSFREMAMLQHQRIPQHHTPSLASTGAPYHPSHQQASPNSNSHLYPSSEYYYAQQQQQQQLQSSQTYREYQNDTYQQYPPKITYSSNTSQHQGEHWNKSRRSIPSDTEVSDYPQRGQERIQNTVQPSSSHSEEGQYQLYSKHVLSSHHSPPQQEPQYRSVPNTNVNDQGYDRHKSHS
ncbi:hypothetical protein BGZ76_007972 [Entomortierella beljakovae]|nr:hypothetical protein BGZ76_007972 [Entomortierella beljakovae]